MKLTQHLIGYAPVKLIAALCSFGGIYVFTRLLDADEYGRFALMFSAMAIIHTISLSWVEAASYRFTAEAARSGNLKDHYRSSLVMLFQAMLFSLVCVGILLLLTWDTPNYRAFVPYIALLLPVNTIVKITLEAHKAQQQVRRYMLVASTKLAVGFLVGSVLAWQTGLGALAPFAGLLFAAAGMAVIEGRWMIKQSVGGKFKPNTRKRWLLYGVPLALALALDLLLSSIDRFLILYFLDEAAVGAYAAGYGVADKTILVLASWVAMAGSPLLMAAYERADHGAVQKQAKQFVNTFLLVALPAATGLALVAKPLSEAMIGEALREQAQQIIPWIAFAGLLNGLLIHYFSESFQLTRKTATRAVLMIAPLVANIVLNLILIPAMGVMGAVVATLVSYVLAIVLFIIVGRFHLALPIPLRQPMLIGIASLAMWPVLHLLPAFGSWLELFTKALAGAITYGAVILAFDVLGVRALLVQKLAKR